CTLPLPFARPAARSEPPALPFSMPQARRRRRGPPASERARMLRAPPDVLITTPESLYLLLTSQARETLRAVETVIVDEIHAMVAGKRGSHLFLSLERLEELRGEREPLQRIGLSATQPPLDDDLRQFAAAGGEARGSAERVGGQRDRARAPRERRAREARRDRGPPEEGRAALHRGDQLAGAGHRHGQRGPGDPDRSASV